MAGNSRRAGHVDDGIGHPPARPCHAGERHRLAALRLEGRVYVRELGERGGRRASRDLALHRGADQQGMETLAGTVDQPASHTARDPNIWNEENTDADIRLE